MYICKFCNKNSNSERGTKYHERCCKLNPNKSISADKTQKWIDSMNLRKGKGTNQFTKAKELGFGKPNSSSPSFKGKTHTQETKNKMSESMKKAHSEGRAWNIGKSRWNNEPSYPEKFFVGVIENEFIDKEYKQEFSIGVYSADFCWPHLMKVIEIDGGQHQRFEEYIERDKRKDLFLSKEGYTVLRVVWQEMFNNTKDKIKECYNFIHED